MKSCMLGGCSQSNLFFANQREISAVLVENFGNPISRPDVVVEEWIPVGRFRAKYRCNRGQAATGRRWNFCR